MLKQPALPGDVATAAMSDKHTHRARKRFGQNFLIDKSIIQSIADAVNPSHDDCLVEIGPGLGALTEPLISRCNKLTVVELDRDLTAKLETLATRLAGNGQTLQVINADALAFDFNQFAAEQGTRVRVVGNLPYNISTPLLFHLLKSTQQIDDMHFMLQKEVVERMVAVPGNKTYGKLTIMLQWQCEIAHLFDVPPEAFKPVPAVNSAVVRIQPKQLTETERAIGPALEKIVSAAFTQRRKTLRNSLSAWLNTDDMATLDIDPKARAETLDIEAFSRLASAVETTK